MFKDNKMHLLQIRYGLIYNYNLTRYTEVMWHIIFSILITYTNTINILFNRIIDNNFICLPHTVSDKYENVPIADSVQIESQINVNLQLSDSDDVNSEKVEVQCNSDCEEYENENVQLVSDDLRPKEDIESRKVLEKEYNNDDPGNWPQNINDKLRIYLVKNPPSKIKNYKFPSNDEGRKFSVIHYNIIMANGENVLRNWLLYSKSLNRVFCLYCRLFPSKSTSSLASIGFSN
ncbi:hypothetical protein QTP88_009147 [Uroleucon formosanum]